MHELRLVVMAAGTAMLLFTGCSTQTQDQNAAASGSQTPASGSPAATDGASASQDAASASPSDSQAQPEESDVSASPTASAQCTPGPSEIGGIKVVSHCGPATGQFKYKGKITKVSPGTCQISQGAWVLNLGSTVVDPKANPKKRAAVPYLGIVAGKLNPKATKAPNLAKIPARDILVTFHGAGVADSIKAGKAKIKFSAGGDSGTFSGPTLKGQRVTGKFNCGQ